MLKKKLQQQLQVLTKQADCLKLSPTEQAFDVSIKSKFGGLPYAEARDIWKVCKSCHNELTFVAQLYHAKQQALVTFFYCFHCFPWGSSDKELGQWQICYYPEPSMDKYVAPVRIQQQREQQNKTDTYSSFKKLLDMLPSLESEPLSITPCLCQHQSVLSLPDWQDLELIMPEAVKLFEKLDPDDPWEAYAEFESEQGFLSDYVTLIDGYPRWVQGNSEFFCKKCDAEMEFFAQIDSEDNAGIMWGDAGLVYLFQCSKHRTEFEIELQCY